jgi:hypothetical protein
MKIATMKITAPLALVSFALLFCSLPAMAAELHAYAPSGERQALLTVAIEPKATAPGAAPVHVTPLGFKGTTIVAHPTQPWLYVSGAAAAAGGPNAAVVRLAATGLPESVEACTPADDVPWGMAISSDGRFLAVTNFGSKTLSVYRIDAEVGLERLTTVDVEDRLMDVVVR